MSRSYRHSSWRPDKSFKNHTYPYQRNAQTEANHRVRQYTKRKLRLALATDIDTISLPQHMEYKRLYDSWDISDYKFRWDPTYEGYDNYMPRHKWFGK